MYCIVPLAGPDFYSEKFGIRPFYLYKGERLIEYVLKTRPWIGSLVPYENIIFVLRETDKTAEAKDILQKIYPGSRCVSITHLTKGAALSALSAVSQITDFAAPIIIDLADIAYTLNIDSVARLLADNNTSGIIPYFESSNPNYSYIRFFEGYIRETKEKEVISNNASTGTYFFSNAYVFLESVTTAIQRPEAFTTNNNFFVCPLYNALISNNHTVVGLPASNVEEVSLIFKT